MHSAIDFLTIKSTMNIIENFISKKDKPLKILENYKYRFLINIVGGTVWRCTLKNYCSSITVNDKNKI